MVKRCKEKEAHVLLIVFTEGSDSMPNRRDTSFFEMMRINVNHPNYILLWRTLLRWNTEDWCSTRDCQQLDLSRGISGCRGMSAEWSTKNMSLPHDTWWCSNAGPFQHVRSRILVFPLFHRNMTRYLFFNIVSLCTATLHGSVGGSLHFVGTESPLMGWLENQNNFPEFYTWMTLSH